MYGQSGDGVGLGLHERRAGLELGWPPQDKAHLLSCLYRVKLEPSPNPRSRPPISPSGDLALPVQTGLWLAVPPPPYTNVSRMSVWRPGVLPSAIGAPGPVTQDTRLGPQDL